MDTHQDVYIFYINNEKNSLAEISVQLIQDKQNPTSTSYTNSTLYWYHTFSITTFEYHIAIFEQGLPIMYILINHHKFFSATSPGGPANFGQAMKGPYQFNFIKG